MQSSSINYVYWCRFFVVVLLLLTLNMNFFLCVIMNMNGIFFICFLGIYLYRILSKRSSQLAVFSLAAKGTCCFQILLFGNFHFPVSNHSCHVFAVDPLTDPLT